MKNTGVQCVKLIIATVRLRLLVLNSTDFLWQDGGLKWGNGRKLVIH